MPELAKSDGNVTQNFPFSNKGLVQRVDISQLAPDQYSFLLNIISEQEGALKPRLGWQQLATTWGGGQPSYAHTISVSRSYPLDPLTVYIGEGTNIRRNVYNGTTSTSSSIIGAGVSGVANRASYPIWRNTASSSEFMAYFATGNQELKDNGSYSQARVWGIDPPTDFCRCAPGDYSFVNIIKSGTFNGTYSLTNARISDTVASVTAIVANSGADGYYAIAPTAGSTTINKLLPGMYLKVASMDIFVDKIDPVGGLFYAHFPALPAATNTIDGYESGNASTTSGVLDITSNPGVVSANLAFKGSAADGYETDDNIHLSLYISTPATITDIRFRLQAGSSSTDFYEKSLLPSPAQQVIDSATNVSDVNNAANTLNDYGRYKSNSVYGQIIDDSIQSELSVNPYIPPPDNISAGLQPSSSYPLAGGTWNEYTISKKEFLKVGRAGQSGYTWANITAVQLVVKADATTSTGTVKIGSIFAYGGSGLNSDRSMALQPYDYVYTFFDSTTGVEGNPSALMIPASAIRVSKEAIKVQVRGQSNINEYAGVDSIRIYRRGGAFTDGLFRKVGQIVNPGSGSTSVFEDSLDDISIVGAKIAEFDNFPPVQADVPFATNVTVSAVTDNGNNNYSITLSASPVLYTAVGSAFTINPTDNDTDTEIHSFINTFLTAFQFTAYCQRTPVVGEVFSVSTLPRAASRVACVAFDRMWINGGFNQSRLYSSKTGRPEAFPVINESTLNSHVVDVSAPDDPINGLIEFNGELLVLTQNGLYTIRLDQGQIIGPFRAPSSRGLFTVGAFCRVDNEVWFLSYDGVYAWNGSALRKVSLALDPMFNGKTVNGISPVDFDGSFGTIDAISFFSICTKENEVWMNYLNTNGYFNTLRYHTIFDRWSLEEYYNPSSSVTIDRNGETLNLTSITAMSEDKSTGNVICGFSTTNGGSTLCDIAFLDVLAKDKVNSGSGSQIYFQATTGALDMGLPMQQKNFTDLSIESTIGAYSTDTYTVQAYYDYGATAEDIFDISPSANGRQIFPYPLGQSGSPSANFGREARVAKYELWGLSSSEDNAFHNFSLSYINLADLQRGRIMDWSDLGHPYDKRMNTVTIQYDVGSSEVDMYLDYIYSKDGDTTVLGAQTITLGAGVGTARAEQTFAIDADIVAKLVRLRPVVSTAKYQIFGTPIWNFDPYPPDIVKFTDYSDYGHPYEKRFYVLYLNVDTNGQTVSFDIEGDGVTKQSLTVSGTASNRMISKAINIDIIAKLVRLKVTNIPTGGKFQLFDHKFEKEDFPPETVLSTPWDDHGYEYLKYVEQLNFDVNTNGYDIPVQVWGDGVLKQTITVNTTQSTRNKNVTLNPSLNYQIMRLVVDPTLIPSGGRFQLWGYKSIFQPADKGPVGHTFDWTDAGHPYDKKFVEMTFEYETQSNSIQIAIDTLTGIAGTTETLAVKTFNITSPGRGKAVIPMLANDNSEIIAKMVRVRSTGIGGGGSNNPDFKMWNVQFPGLIPYPADITPFTDFSDLGWACGSIFRGLGLEIDTGGVDCVVHLDIDDQEDLETWTVNTTTNNRRVFLSQDFNAELAGKMFRLRFTPGNGGKAQLFGQPNWDVVKDACEFLFFDTFEQAFGSVGYTIMYQQWIDYKCAGTVTMKFYNDDNTLFYTKVLPVHTSRKPERFYLPAANGGVNNKSKKRRMTLEANDVTKPFRLYADATRSEMYNLSADQRAGFYQNIVWQNIKIQV